MSVAVTRHLENSFLALLKAFLSALEELFSLLNVERTAIVILSQNL